MSHLSQIQSPTAPIPRAISAEERAPFRSHQHPLAGTITGILTGLLAVEMAMAPLCASAMDPTEVAVEVEVEDQVEDTQDLPVVDQPGEETYTPMDEAMPMPEKNGLGLLITGGIVGGMGLGYLGMSIAALSDESAGPASALAGFTLGSFSALHLIVATPLLAVGGVRMHRYRRWKESRSTNMALHFNRSRHGTVTSGIQIRF